jgi:hypothetical protein
MSDIKLDYVGQTGDLDTTGHRLNLTTGVDAIEQNLRIRLRFVYESWFLDRRLGIPYWDTVLIKNPNMLLVTNIFRTAIDETTGIAGVDRLDADLDRSTRQLSISFSARTDTGEVIDYTSYNPFVIEI